MRPDLPDVLLPQNYQPPPDLRAAHRAPSSEPDGNLVAVGPPLVNPNPNLADPNPPLRRGWRRSRRYRARPTRPDVPPPRRTTVAAGTVAGTAARDRSARRGRSGVLRRQRGAGREPARSAFRLGAHHRVSPRATATQLLLGPLARGTTVSLAEPAANGRIVMKFAAR